MKDRDEVAAMLAIIRQYKDSGRRSASRATVIDLLAELIQVDLHPDDSNEVHALCEEVLQPARRPGSQAREDGDR